MLLAMSSPTPTPSLTANLRKEMQQWAPFAQMQAQHVDDLARREGGVDGHDDEPEPQRRNMGHDEIG